MARNVSKLMKYKNISYMSFRTKASGIGNENELGLGPSDVMGLPDSKSNLRALKIQIPADETREEKQYRIEREKLQIWNQEYWENHNNLFKTEKETFIKNQLQKLSDMGEVKKSLNVEEMATFYKEFLNTNHNKHVQYNWEWYSKNFYILFLSLKAELSKLRK